MAGKKKVGRGRPALVSGEAVGYVYGEPASDLLLCSDVLATQQEALAAIKDEDSVTSETVVVVYALVPMSRVAARMAFTITPITE
jgi:hypothetical protein